MIDGGLGNAFIVNNLTTIPKDMSDMYIYSKFSIISNNICAFEDPSIKPLGSGNCLLSFLMLRLDIAG